jgi:hypothetical protein
MAGICSPGAGPGEIPMALEMPLQAQCEIRTAVIDKTDRPSIGNRTRVAGY